jgi:hypothetical protein
VQRGFPVDAVKQAEGRTDMRKIPTQSDVALARARFEAQCIANCDGLPMAVYVWDGESGTKRYAIRHWDETWDNPGLVHVAHPSTIKQGG